MLKITTNNHRREFMYRDEVPAHVLGARFSYLKEECDGFFRYQGWWEHINDFDWLGPDSQFEGWDSCKPDTAFSGTLVKINPDGSYTVGRYIQTEEV